MKRLLLTSASLLARITATATASATTTTIPFSGAIIDFIVPADGSYQILAFGAQGGSSTDFIHKVVSPGGKGAEIGGDFILTKGEVLQIAVGGQGQSESASPNSGGGGGGSFVFDLRNKPLVVAGGGGGAGGGFSYAALPGKAGYGGQTGGDGADGFGRLSIEEWAAAAAPGPVAAATAAVAAVVVSTVAAAMAQPLPAATAAALAL
jgi:hypothetical protein